MINRCELITLHILDLLELLDADLDGQGSLVLMVDGEEHAEVDLANLCLVLKIDEAGSVGNRTATIPFSATALTKP